MNKSLSKILTIVILVLAVLGAIFYGMSINGAEETLEAPMGRYVGYALFLLIVAAGIAVVFSLLNLFKKPALLKKTLLSLGVLAIVLAVAYAMADGGTVTDASGKIFEVTKEGSTSKWVDTGIWYSLILLVVGAALFLWDMVKNLIK
jgi:formate-dependent nitrite reductase membrane component NrfD